MSTNAPHTPGEFGEPPPRPATERGPAYYLRKGVKALASLQLTVGLFALGILLIFFGTLAQLDYGIWTVVDEYFASWIVWIPFELIHRFLGVFWKEQFAGTSDVGRLVPVPGRVSDRRAMLINLLAAHALRFRLSWKRAGIFLIHGGHDPPVRRRVHHPRVRRRTADDHPRGQSVNFAEDTRQHRTRVHRPVRTDGRDRWWSFRRSG